MNEVRPKIPVLRTLGTEFERLETTGGRFSIRVRARAWLTALGVGVLIAFTPQGQALAEHLGQLVGLGAPDEGGNYGDGSQIVARGETTNGHPYQVVALRSDVPCTFLGFPEVRGTGMGSCDPAGIGEDLDELKISPLIYRAPTGLLPDGEAVLQGLVAPDVDRIVIHDEDIYAPTREIPTRLIRTYGGLGFFVAFVPPGALSPPISDQTPADLQGIVLTAFDADGEQIAQRHIGDGADEDRLDQLPLANYETGEVR
jgi:hypothetical protein